MSDFDFKEIQDTIEITFENSSEEEFTQCRDEIDVLYRLDTQSGKLLSLLSCMNRYALLKGYKISGISDEEDLVNFYKACSLFVLPSIFRSEAFGIVLIEAMASGKSVISTELGTGTSFVNQDGITGIVIPPQNTGALIWAINKLLRDKKLAEEFGQNALKRAIQEFSFKKMLGRIRKIYKQYLIQPN